MRGLSSTGRPWLLSSLLIAACATKSHPPMADKFSFELHVVVKPEVTDVTANGMSVALMPYGSGRILIYRESFPTYSAGEMSNVVSIEFLAGSVVENTGQLVPGVCAHSCGAPGCPSPMGITYEEIDLPQVDFQPLDWQCMICEGPDGASQVCN